MCETDLCLGVIGLASRHICGCGCLGGTTTTPINSLRTRTRTLCGIRGQSPSIRDEHRVVSFSLLSSSSSSRSVIKSRPPRSVRRPHFQHHDHVPPPESQQHHHHHNDEAHFSCSTCCPCLGTGWTPFRMLHSDHSARGSRCGARCGPGRPSSPHCGRRTLQYDHGG